MLTWFSAEVDVYDLARELHGHRHDERSDEIIGALQGLSPASGNSRRGSWAGRISVQAETLIDAAGRLWSSCERRPAGTPVWCEVITEPEGR